MCVQATTIKAPSKPIWVVCARKAIKRQLDRYEGKNKQILHQRYSFYT